MPLRVESGDDRYAELTTKWEDEGSPWQFEELGSFGYRRWQIHYSEDGGDPTFLLMASAGPTSTGYDEDTETFKPERWRGPTSGAQIDLKDSGLNFSFGRGGINDIRIKAYPQPKDEDV